MEIWKTFLRSLIKLNRNLFPCSVEVPLGRFMSSKLQEKAKKTSLIHTNTLSCRYAVFPNKDSNQSSSLKKCSNPPGLQRHPNLRHSFDFKLHASSRNFITKQTLAQVFSCEFCEISKNTFYYRTPMVAASVHLILYHFYLVLRHSVNIVAHILFHYFFLYTFLFKFVFNCSC